MKAVILAAGKGTRLADLTKNCPKPMVPVGGKPCLERIIGCLQGAGVQDFVIVTGYMAHVIYDYFQDGSNMGVHITYVHQHEQTGTGSALHMTQSAVGESAFVMTYGDIMVPEANYIGLVAAFNKWRSQAILGLNWVDDPYRGAAVYLGEYDQVVKIEEKPPQGTATTHWNNAGIYVFDPIIFNYTAKLKLSPRGEYELPDAVQAMLSDGCDVRGYRLEGYWRDIGTPADVKAAHSYFQPQNDEV